MNLYLICFDITDTKRRNRIGRLLGSYGERVQRSVFEVPLRSDAELRQLRDELTQVLRDAEGETSIRFYPLCSRCRAGAHTADGTPIAESVSALFV